MIWKSIYKKRAAGCSPKERKNVPERRRYRLRSLFLWQRTPGQKEKPGMHFPSQHCSGDRRASEDHCCCLRMHRHPLLTDCNDQGQTGFRLLCCSREGQIPGMCRPGLSESLQLLFVLKPDNKFITDKIRWLQIRWHCITAFHESVILCHGIRMNDRTDRIISNRSGWFENNVHIGVSCCF